MSSIILGAGIGAIILSSLWIFALLLCFVSLRTKYNLGPLAITAVLFLTIILLYIPRNVDSSSAISETKILDPLFVWRTTVFLFLCLSAITGYTCIFLFNVTEIKQAHPMKHWYLHD